MPSSAPILRRASRCYTASMSRVKLAVRKGRLVTAKEQAFAGAYDEAATVIEARFGEVGGIQSDVNLILATTSNRAWIFLVQIPRAAIKRLFRDTRLSSRAVRQRGPIGLLGRHPPIVVGGISRNGDDERVR